MDEMRIKGKFFDVLIASFIKKYIKNHFDIEPGGLDISNLDISMGKNLEISGSVKIIFAEKDTEKIKQQLLNKIF